MKKLLTLSALLATTAIPAFASPADEGPLAVSVGYADTYHPGGGHPAIWDGTPQVQFVGTSASIKLDAGAIKLHNQNPFAVTVTKVTVDIGTMLGINVWVAALPITIPPGAQLVLTQTAPGNFDTSDMPKGGVSCTPNGIKAVVHVTEKIGSATSVTYSFIDSAQTLNTGGIDADSCGKSESSGQWAKVEPINDGGICK